MKRLFCILLTVTMLLTLCLSASAYSLWEADQPGVTVNPVTVDESVAQYKEQVDKNAETRRYYFQMPDGVHGHLDESGKPAASWYNEYSRGAGIFWWGDVPAAPTDWTGYRANVADADQHIYQFRASELTFDSFEEIAWTRDGEYGGTYEHVTVKNLQRALKIMVDPAYLPQISDQGGEVSRL